MKTMLRNFLTLLIASVMFFACNSGNNGEESNDKDSTDVAAENETAEEIVEVTVANFNEKAPELVNKKVKISGMVMHICQHGGKRMFIEDDTHTDRIKITAGENIPQFDLALETEGAEVEVIGEVEELIIDEEYLAEWEAELEAQKSEPDEEIGRAHV